MVLATQMIFRTLGQIEPLLLRQLVLALHLRIRRQSGARGTFFGVDAMLFGACSHGPTKQSDG